MTYEHDLHRHDDDGGHLGPREEFLVRAYQRWLSQAIAYCKALDDGMEVWETGPMLAAFRSWRDA